MTGWSAGERKALSEIYDQFASFVYGLALRVLSASARRQRRTSPQDVFVATCGGAGASGVPTGDRAAHTSLGAPSPTAGPSITSARRRRAAVAIKDAARPAGTTPDVEEMARRAPVTAERVRSALGDASRRPTARHPPRVLRQARPPGGGGARHPRGDGEAPAAPGPAPHRRRARDRVPWEERVQPMSTGRSDARR